MCISGGPDGAGLTCALQFVGEAHRLAPHVRYKPRRDNRFNLSGVDTFLSDRFERHDLSRRFHDVIVTDVPKVLIEERPLELLRLVDEHFLIRIEQMRYES